MRIMASNSMRENQLLYDIRFFQRDVFGRV